LKTEKNILIAFLLNITFSIFELIGGILTNSVAIISDAIHDFGDATSIGISYFLEKKSKRRPDNNYTYGYVRYSILGAIITNTILIVGSALVIFSAVDRFFNPANINYDGMIIFALFGVVVNLLAANFTKGGHSLNQKAVNLHMLEDVLGWIVVLVGAIVIKFTELNILDPIMSILVAVFILFNALKSYKSILDLFLEKTPAGIKIEELKEDLLKIKNVIDVHHIHVWSIDGFNNYATMHVVIDTKNDTENIKNTKEDIKSLKDNIKNKLKERGITHTTIEIEDKDYVCEETECSIDNDEADMHHTHHHHHRH